MFRSSSSNALCCLSALTLRLRLRESYCYCIWRRYSRLTTALIISCVFLLTFHIALNYTSIRGYEVVDQFHDLLDVEELSRQPRRALDNVTCPRIPPGLLGPIKVSNKSLDMEVVNAMMVDGFSSGGFYKPIQCLFNFSVALIIPFRNRDAHLSTFLNHIIPILKRQRLEFGIYVVDQASGSQFNRGMLMNIGFKEALKDKPWDCFIFHDVDLLPADDRILYSCSTRAPRHLSAAIDIYQFKIPYATIFGGVSSFHRTQFEMINGFSNAFFGWGAEDDDLYQRITYMGFTLMRYPLQVSRYVMLKHSNETGNEHTNDNKSFLLGRGGARRLGIDGLSTLHYTLVAVLRNPLFTKLFVKIDQKAVRAELEGKLRTLGI